MEDPIKVSDINNLSITNKDLIIVKMRLDDLNRLHEICRPPCYVYKTYIGIDEIIYNIGDLVLLSDIGNNLKYITKDDEWYYYQASIKNDVLGVVKEIPDSHIPFFVEQKARQDIISKVFGSYSVQEEIQNALRDSPYVVEDNNIIFNESFSNKKIIEKAIKVLEGM